MATIPIRRPFTKPASSPEQLLQKLKDRGLSVRDDAQALAYLRGVGAYRLKGYWHHLVHPVSKRFPAGSEFEEIRQRCEFDRGLRIAAIEAVDRLEVAIRAAMADHLSITHSPHWYLDHRIFKPTTRWGIGQMIRKVETEVLRASGKPFVRHYLDRHDDPYLPPSWAISECVSFGMWSHTFAILRDPNDRKAISMRFSVDQVQVFESWIHAVAVLRNIAAHHGQLLGVQLGVAPAHYKRRGMIFRQPKSFFAIATVVQYLLRHTGLPHRWDVSLDATFTQHPHIDPTELGFPPNWATMPGW